MSNPELKLLAFDEDYDFNLPPPPEEEGKPVNVDVSLNLRNILQVHTAHENYRTVEENLADLLVDASRYCIFFFPHFPPILREGKLLTKKAREKNPVLAVVIYNFPPRSVRESRQEGKKEGHSVEIKGAAMHLSFFSPFPHASAVPNAESLPSSFLLISRSMRSRRS